MRTGISTLVAMLMVCACEGCASYAAPGRGADLAAVGAPNAAQFGPGTDGVIRQAFDKRPMPRFPASVAVARIQAPYYTSYSHVQGYGEGRFSVVATRDIEKPEQLERLAKLPQLRAIAPINRMLIQGRLDSELPLRQAAAALQADMLLIYTLDTVFDTENKAIPLSVVSLGLSPNKQVRVTTTASALLMDTRNGYLYGLAEATAQQNRFTNDWQNAVAIDETRRATETEAFGKLVGELETTWQNVLATHNPSSPAVARQSD